VAMFSDSSGREEKCIQKFDEETLRKNYFETPDACVGVLLKWTLNGWK
jgi:hypothetical protein